MAVVIFHRLAAKEARLAVQRYDRVRPELGARFRAAVDDAGERIAADPESFPIERRRFRQVRVRRFPYQLFYAVLSPELIEVIAVAHRSRRPGYWQHRQP